MSQQRHDHVQKRLKEFEARGFIDRWSIDRSGGSSKYLVWVVDEDPSVMTLMTAEAYIDGVTVADEWHLDRLVSFIVTEEGEASHVD